MPKENESEKNFKIGSEGRSGGWKTTPFYWDNGGVSYVLSKSEQVIVQKADGSEQRSWRSAIQLDKKGNLRLSKADCDHLVASIKDMEEKNNAED